MQKRKFRVGEGCALCMTCIYQCPVKAITLVEDASAVIDEEKCVGCGRCYHSCQPGVITEVNMQE